MVKLEFPHRQAGHCESGVTRNLLTYHGLPISEPMAFGIGAGLFFSYLPFLKMQHAPTTSFRVWPGQVFERTTRELGVKTRVHTFRDPKESMAKLEQVLDQGLPVGLQVGTFHLPFFPPEYRMHYNMHNMVVYGYDQGNYYISDTVMEKLVEINYEDLMRVRFAKGAFAPQGRMYYPVEVPKGVDIRPAIVRGIRKTANNMVGVPFPLIGAKGIRYLEQLGYRVELAPHIYHRRGYLAGTDEQRTADLHQLFSNPKVKAIFTVRGGYGTMRSRR